MGVGVDNVFSHVFKGRIFLPQDMIKHSSTTDQKSKLKEYFDQLKVIASNTCHFLMHSGQCVLCLQTFRFYSVAREPLVCQDFVFSQT